MHSKVSLYLSSTATLIPSKVVACCTVLLINLKLISVKSLDKSIFADIFLHLTSVFECRVSNEVRTSYGRTFSTSSFASRPSNRGQLFLAKATTPKSSTLRSVSNEPTSTTATLPRDSTQRFERIPEAPEPSKPSGPFIPAMPPPAVDHDPVWEPEEVVDHYVEVSQQLELGREPTVRVHAHVSSSLIAFPLFLTWSSN
jgi:hypothetical protein